MCFSWKTQNELLVKVKPMPVSSAPCSWRFCHGRMAREHLMGSCKRWLSPWGLRAGGDNINCWSYKRRSSSWNARPIWTQTSFRTCHIVGGEPDSRSSSSIIVNTCIYLFIYIYIFIFIYLYLYIYIYIFIFILYTRIHVYTYVNLCIHTHMSHIQIHTVY